MSPTMPEQLRALVANLCRECEKAGVRVMRSGHELECGVGVDRQELDEWLRDNYPASWERHVEVQRIMDESRSRLENLEERQRESERARRERIAEIAELVGLSPDEWRMVSRAMQHTEHM